jgi:hypothetical protein
MPTYQKIVWIGVAVATIAILALAYFLFLAPAAEKKAVTLPETASLGRSLEPAAPEAGAGIDPDIVPLDLDLEQSDSAVRSLIAAGEIPAAMRGWLQQTNILRTVVAAVDSIARGESPAGQLPFLAPRGKFLAYEKNGIAYLDPRSFQRYDSLVGVFTAIPDKTWITWYKRLLPTLEKAFRELGFPGVTFAERLRQAIEHLLQTPPTRGEIALEKRILSYAYADPGLEDLSPAQKHLLRLGPGSAARVQKKLRSLAAALAPSGNK